jgi:diacylglycerol kinase (ATP)
MHPNPGSTMSDDADKEQRKEGGDRDGRSPGERRAATLGRKPKMSQSFNNALEGIVYALKTERNIRIHFIVGVVVIGGSLFLNISRLELVLIIVAVALVLVAELINTAIEKAMDLMTTTYHPLAKLVKDIAAGAVFIAAIAAVIVGYLVLFKGLKPHIFSVIRAVKGSPEYVTLISFTLVIILVILGKVLFGRGSPLHGGMPSGHAAVSFAIFAIVTLVTENPLVSVLVFLLALIIADTRIRRGIHTWREVTAGALLGIGVVSLNYWLFLT